MEQCFPDSRAIILEFLHADATTVKSTISWITVVPGVVNAVFTLNLTAKTNETTAEAISRHGKSQPVLF